MATDKEKKDPRQDAWNDYVENYIKSNPEKGTAKKARGEFDKIPDTFVPKQ